MRHLRGEDVHHPKKQQTQPGTEPPRGGDVFGLQVVELHHRGPDAHLREDFHHTDHDEGNGHDAKVLFCQKLREDADVDELQNDLQQDIEALPTQRRPPQGRAAFGRHQRAMLTARRSRMTVILT